MRFLDRVHMLGVLRRGAWSTARHICDVQRRFGDFHLKTTLAIAAHDLLTLCEVLERKAAILDLGLSLEEADSATPGAISEASDVTVAALLRSIAERFDLVFETASTLLHGLDTYTDIKLQADLEGFIRLAGRDRAALREWMSLGPTETRELQQSLGLVRDCVLYDPDLRLGSESRVTRLNEEHLREPALRANYLSANAYLELSSVDILSDLIQRVGSSNDPALRRLVSDLSRQLLDEARHAELLAARVEGLGYELGCAPVCLHTWRVYESFDSVAERLVVQQVLQEGVGLDSSAQNIVRMARIGDLDSADVYAQITADEKTHVDLGLRWAATLVKQPIVELMASVAARAEALEPMPRVPVSLELRRQCRYPEEWLAREVADKGLLPIDDIRAAVLRASARATYGRSHAERGS